MKKLLYLGLPCLFSLGLQAQYATPGTGVHWNLDSLLMYSGGVVYSGENGFGISEDLELSENDTLTLAEPVQLLVSENVSITFSGRVHTMGQVDLPLSFVAGAEDVHWGGIRIEETATALFENTTFSDGGGIKCISGDVTFAYCTIERQENQATNSAALEFFSGTPFVTDCIFEDNMGAAISSPANIACAPQINASQFTGNNTENGNRPQINLGPSGAGEVIYITNNTIVGDPGSDQTGGISVASFFGTECNVLIDLNTIEGNRYGIAVQGGGITGEISANTIIDNDIQGEPLLGGSGINLNGTASSSALVYNNFISGNLWGVTVQGEFQVDLGNPEVEPLSLGNNIFSENGNGGVTYALYNNTPSPIPAMNNCWIQGQESTVEQVEDVIFHSVDDSSLGAVDFSAFQCGIVDGLYEVELLPVSVSPNPSDGRYRLEIGGIGTIHSAHLIDPLGRTSAVDVTDLRSGRIDISGRADGIYGLLIRSDRGRFFSRLLKN